MDFKQINEELLSKSESVLNEWFPNGNVRGSEFVIGNIQGDQGDSLSVNIDTGIWADFAANDKGTDLISLYAAINNISQGDAAKKLNPGWQPVAKKTSVVRKSKLKFVKPPKNSKPEIKGRPDEVYTYRDIDGDPVFYIAKYIIKNKKVFSTYSYDGQEWQKKAWPNKRPIYGLELLNSKPILIVEGEKCANTLRVICTQYTVVSWPGGGNAVDKTDWSVLENRNILIWPDADEPGFNSAQKIAFKLHGKTKSLKVLKIDNRPKGWDCVDAIASGWSWGHIIEWAKPIAESYQPPAKVEIVEEPDDEEGVCSLYDGHSCDSLWEALGLSRMKNGSVHCNTDNIVRILSGVKEFKNMFWFDEFHNKYFTKYHGKVTEWTDNDELNFMVLIQGKIGLTKINSKHINEAVRYVANQDVRNEPKEWMDSLEWDNVNRLDNFFIDCFGSEDNEYTRAASANWLVSMVARIYSPGCKVDNMVIFESKQGKMKSTALDVIGSPWYAEVNESVNSKDFYLSIQGRMVIEISELDSFSKAESNTIKKVITCREDRFRPPYGRATESFPRKCIFAGSTNEDHYMRDDTGGRRFWPVKITNINIDKIRAQKEQLFAEAVSRYKKGQTWWVMPESAKDEQELRRQQDIWEDIVSDWLIKNQKTDITTHNVAIDCLKLDMAKIDRRTQSRICNILKILEWESKTVRSIGIKPQRKWIKPLTLNLY